MLLPIIPKKPKDFNATTMIGKREAIVMTDADVTPNGKWKDSPFATVVVHKPPPGPNDSYSHVPIRIVRWADAATEIRSSDFPKGVVLVNELALREDHSNTETTVGDLKFNIRIVQPPVPPGKEDVAIIKNVGWPSGEIILWTTQQPD